MEHLEFEGRKYVKVSSAARETGYTSDYIGQLCRAKKIDAKLVGRTWYVAQDELTQHQRTRGRSSYEKVRKQVREQVAAVSEVAIPLRRISTLSPSHERLLRNPITYHRDENELIPTVPAPERLKVVSSDTEVTVATKQAERSVEVASDEVKEQKITPVRHAEEAEVKWNGTIVVQPLETETEAEEESPSVLPSEKHIRISSETERNNKVNLDISEIAHDPLEAKQRFLERMNLAHELNTTSVRSVRSQSVKDSSDSMLPGSRHTIAHTPPVRTENTELASRGKSPLHATASVLLGAVSVAALVFALSSAFVETSIVYSAAGKDGTAPSVLMELGFSSVDQVKDLLGANISSERDNYVLGRINSVFRF